MSLNELRNQIDDIDEQITSLFGERMKICAKIAEYKQENDLGVRDEARERAVLDKISSLCEAELAPYAVTLYKTMFELSRDYQSKKATDTRGGAKEDA